jgi:hypothetical protein
MKTIYKYTLKVESEQVLKLPKDADILCVQEQHGEICLWAIVEKDTKEFENKIFYIYGTGHDVPWPALQTYIGTVQQRQGTLVWHIFMRHIP